MLSPRNLRTASIASLFLSLAIAVAFAQGDRRDRVSYTTFRPGNWDIFRFSEPGAPPERLTADPSLDYDPYHPMVDGWCFVLSAWVVPICSHWIFSGVESHGC